MVGEIITIGGETKINHNVFLPPFQHGQHLVVEVGVVGVVLPLPTILLPDAPYNPVIVQPADPPYHHHYPQRVEGDIKEGRRILRLHVNAHQALQERINRYFLR